MVLHAGILTPRAPGWPCSLRWLSRGYVPEGKFQDFDFERGGNTAFSAFMRSTSSCDFKTTALACCAAPGASALSSFIKITDTSGRSRFSSPMIRAASEPSSLRSTTTAPTTSWPNRRIPLCPLPELSTSQPCRLSSEQRRFKLTGSFPMQRTELPRRLLTRVSAFRPWPQISRAPAHDYLWVVVTGVPVPCSDLDHTQSQTSLGKFVEVVQPLDLPKTTPGPSDLLCCWKTSISPR